MSEKNRQDDKSRQSKSQTDRAERLSAELRANLKKRKELIRQTKKNGGNA